LIITEAKIPLFFVCKRTGFVHQELRDFAKMTLTRVSDCDSSRVILWKTWLESSYQKSWFDWSRVTDSSHAITEFPTPSLNKWWSNVWWWGNNHHEAYRGWGWPFFRSNFSSYNVFKFCRFRGKVIL